MMTREAGSNEINLNNEIVQRLQKIQRRMINSQMLLRVTKIMANDG